MFTFDSYGVSGHRNHIDAARAARLAVADFRREKRDAGIAAAGDAGDTLHGNPFIPTLHISIQGCLQLDFSLCILLPVLCVWSTSDGQELEGPPPAECVPTE